MFFLSMLYSLFYYHNLNILVPDCCQMPHWEMCFFYFSDLDKNPQAMSIENDHQLQPYLYKISSATPYLAPGCLGQSTLVGGRPWYCSSPSLPLLSHKHSHFSTVYPRLRPPRASCCCCCCGCWWRNLFLEASMLGGPMPGRMDMFPAP